MLKSSVPSNNTSNSADDHRFHLRRRIWRERSVLIPLLGAALLARLCLGVVKVDGRSMEPTYHTGDTLYVLKSYRYLSPLKPGDIVVAHLEHGRISGESIVKRVVFVQNATGNAPWPQGIPGPNHNAAFNEVFSLYVNGALTAPPNSIIVLGDNYDNSMDSRDFGPLSTDEIVGKVIKP